MKKIFFLSAMALALTLSVGNVSAQKDSTLHRVPKQISIEVGYRNVFSVIDRSANPFVNSASNGYGFLVDYAWKLGGLTGKKPGIYLSVPIGYSVMMPDNNASKSISMLNYGWTIRHELSVNKPITPFLGYGLLLNTLKLAGTDGGIMGHQTQFEFGANLNTKTRLKYFAKLEYSYTSYPKLGDSKRIHFQYLDFRVGARF
jgi:hypothetical protein